VDRGLPIGTEPSRAFECRHVGRTRDDPGHAERRESAVLPGLRNRRADPERRDWRQVERLEAIGRGKQCEGRSPSRRSGSRVSV
jgi:hypothetical protein